MSWLPKSWVVLSLAATATAWGQFDFRFDRETTRWTLSNSRIEAVLELTPAGNLQFVRLSHLSSGDTWRGAEYSSPLRFTLDKTAYGERTSYRLVTQSAQAMARGGYQQSIWLEDLDATVQVRLDLQMYGGYPVLRYGTRVRNLRSRTLPVRAADLLSWRFAAENGTYRLFRVNQWTVVPRELNFEPAQFNLNPAGTAVAVQSGARGLHCAWLALRDQEDRGLFAGWEFDGRADASVRHFGADNQLELAGRLLNLYHPVEPGEDFQVPWAFVGLFHGDWDEAGYRTQRFVESALAKPVPGPQRFPYVIWDSWGYQTRLDEDTLRHNAEVAAGLGVELFVVDLGWAHAIGDWRADPAKFPSGLRALSDYVHSLGMKFGLHFALTEADAGAPALRDNPDWTSSENYGYFGAASLCLSHQPVKEWIVEQAVRMIDDYDVDWILQDGENPVKLCTKSTHTHDPRDSNYSNSVDGLNEVLATIQRRRPNALWENCENGGNMMTFNMVQYYVTSITNDASGSRGARQAVYGVTYPFPPRYADRYMPEQVLNPYVTRSFLFGGPWIFMNRLASMDPGDLEFARGEVDLFKLIRGKISEGKVFRLTARPAENRIDAIQSYHEPTDSAVAVVTRDGGASERFWLRPRGLRPDGSYQVRFQDDTRILTMSGAQLMGDGVLLRLPSARGAEVAFIDPL